MKFSYSTLFGSGTYTLPDEPMYYSYSTPVKLTPHRCPVCEGRGSLPENFYTRLTIGIGGADVTCKTCEGRGVLWQ